MKFIQPRRPVTATYFADGSKVEVVLSSGGAGWQDLDFSAAPVLKGRMAIIKIATAGSAGLRPDGSDLAVQGTTGGVTLWQILVQLDANGVCEGYYDNVNNVSYTAIGYLD